MSEYGFCRCGCGQRTSIARWNDRSRGYVAGEPKPWLKGHHSRRGVPTSGWIVDEETGCWNWEGTTSNGYGIVRRGSRRYVAHRVLYVDRRGPVPKGMELDHLCRNRRCVNPDHLEPVSRAENARRSPFTKLAAHEVDQIRESTQTNVWLAEQFGVTPSAISRIRSGEVWA